MDLETNNFTSHDIWLCVGSHSLTQYQKSLIKFVERLTLVYHAPMWKTTPTASLQVILNKKKPSHIKVKGVGIRSYIRIKNLFQNNLWDGISYNKRACLISTFEAPGLSNKLPKTGTTRAGS